MASRTALIAAAAALAATPGALAGRPDFHQKMAGPDGAFYGKGFGFEAAPGDMFVNNAARLAEIQAKAVAHGWQAGAQERFEGASMAHVQALCGTYTKGHPSWLPTPAAKLEKTEGSDPPDSFDARDNWPQCASIGHIRDQSDCGSCWAFGSTEAFNDRLCISQGFQGLLSVEDTTACCGLLNCGFSMGCNGGQPSGAWGWFHKTGVVTGGDYGDDNYCLPYSFPPCAHHVNSTKYDPCPSSEYPTPSCDKSCQSEYDEHDYKSDKIKASSSYSLNSEQDIMQSIYEKGPVTGAFTVFDDFPTYKSGVYRMTPGSSALGGHAIKIMGWGEENGDKYWLVANSWNDSWGDGGTFKILRGVNECGIEGDVVAGDV